MPIEIKMPALSPTMEEGTLAKWLVKPGDTVKSGDIMAEIETDKATMEFEAVDEGTIIAIAIPAGSEGVKVGTVIATLAEDGESGGEDASPAPAPKAAVPAPAAAPSGEAQAVSPIAKRLASEMGVDLATVTGTGPSGRIVKADIEAVAGGAPAAATAPVTVAKAEGARVIASPLAKRIAADKGVDLSTIKGSGPNGRIVRADVEGAKSGAAPAPSAAAPAAPAPAVASNFATDIPHEAVKLTQMRKVIARRLIESKQTVPHIYLTVDIQLDALLKLRSELNQALEARGVKLSVNDLLIKALGAALEQVPACNVSYTPEALIQYHRADVSVAVSTPTGLITPIIVDAANKSMSAISTEMKVLADKAKAGKLQPHEFQGGTASLSNMGMFGIKQFEAVINPPQGMIMAIGAGEARPYVVDGALAVATVMSATGSFDHRAIDGADGAQLMQAFKALVEMPLGLVA
jgi:pyruvate dehydrogenase E2 component (dihydrolipoamide acetyltransferase)